MKRIKLSIFCILLFSAILTVNFNEGIISNALALSSKVQMEKAQSNIVDAVNNINYSMIESHVENLTSLTSRVTGYPGSYEAANYIVSKFKKYGLTIIVQNYSMAMPIDSGSWIKTEDGKQIDAYALWPNGPQACSTPPEGITGKLIYVGKGDLSDFNSFDVEGSTILMDFNSGDNWLNAAKLGAKAIIFIEPEYTTSLESLEKTVPTPINIPRFYVKKEEGRILIELASSKEEVTVYSGMQWKEIPAYNVIGGVNGSEYTDSIIVISSHYDSWSIVPSIAPGSEDALAISTLLEIARYFGKNSPLRSLRFVAFSGFYQCIAGPTEWAEQILFSKEVQQGTEKISLHIDLDLSTDDNAIDILFTGPPVGGNSPDVNWFGDVVQMANRYVPVQAAMQNYLSLVNAQDSVRDNLAMKRWGTQPVIRDWIWLYRLSVQPIIRVGLIGFTIRTQYANRLTFLTPLNDTKFIKWENLKPQVTAAMASIAGFANEADWRIPSLIPGRALWGGAGATITTGVVWGFVTLNGTVAEYNVNKGWYTPIQGALVRTYYGGSYSSDLNAYLAWPFNSRYTFSGKEGIFIFHGLAPYLTHGFDAWKFNETSGGIIYAVDEGIYGTASGLAGGIATSVYPLSHPASVLIPIFRCTEITVFDLFDPRLMKRSGVPFSYSPSSLSVYDRTTKSHPVFYGEYFASSYDIGMVFVKPESEVIIAFTPHTVELTRPLILLTNSSEDNLEGYSYRATKPLILYKTALTASEDLYHLSVGRYEKLSSKNIRNQGAETLIEKGLIYLTKAKEYFANKTYDKGYACAIGALALLSKAYDSGVMPLFNDISNFILFFTFPAIFFALFFERLLLQGEGSKKILGIIAVMTIILTILNFVTPAFEVIQNSIMAIFGVGLLLVATFIGVIFLRDAGDLMERVATDKLGMHIVKKGGMDTLVHLLGVAVDNMRRRPSATILTVSTMIMFVIAQTAFTSASQVVVVKESYLSGSRPPYNGILLKRQYGFPPAHRGANLDTIPLAALIAFASDSYNIAPRVWMYPTAIHPYGVSAEIINPWGESVLINPMAFLGMSSEESNLLFDNWTVKGWSRLDMPYNAIISKRMAELLNVTVGDRIFVKNTGTSLVITAIIDVIGSKIMDFDTQTPILPVASSSSSLFARENVGMNEDIPPQWISVDNLIVIPWKLAYDFGGFVSSIAILPKNNVTLDELKDVGSQIALGMDVSVYLSYYETTLGLSRVVTYSISGWNVMWVLLIMTLLSTVNVLVSGVHRRQKEIYTYASLGLSPANAMLMFIVESLTYAVIAVIIGYLLGYCFNLLFITIFPGTFVFNTTSTFIVVSLAAIFIACLGASIYPSTIAAKMITPSLERKWKLRTKPQGDLWAIPIPIKVTIDEEIPAMLVFLSEYYRGVGAIRSGFVVHKVSQVDRKTVSLSLDMSLTPMELGITQRVTFEGTVQKDKTFAFNVLIKRESGDYSGWASRNYYFVDDLRKQIMLWRTLPDKRKYFESAP